MIYSAPMPDVEREIRCAALALLYEQNQRIAALEAQLAALREENRRYVQAKMGGQDGSGVR